MRMLSTKALMIFCLSVFTLTGAAPYADAVYYVKKKKTEDTQPAQKPQTYVAPKAPAKAATPNPVVMPAPQSCTQTDITTLQKIKNYFQDRGLDPKDKKLGKEPPPLTEAGAQNMATFYTTPGNLEKIIDMKVRCAGININTANSKDSAPKKK